jgi:hypothetical protein
LYFVSLNYIELNNNNKQINKFEADYLAALSYYLVNRKGYNADQITILSMYLGQVAQIKSSLAKLNQPKAWAKQLRVTTVDNYQGEENDIVLLSLVRTKAIGFLAENNRICVAVSRARHAMYCVSNASLLRRSSPTWLRLLNTMGDARVGEGLILTCGYHPKSDIKACLPSDILNKVECQLVCDAKLPCGHRCALVCHQTNRHHSLYKCMKVCARATTCGHACKRICSDHQEGECSLYCTEMTDKVISICGHRVRVACNYTPKSSDCVEPCARKLKCGHQCEKLCSVFPCEPCTQLVEVKPNCKHSNSINVKCGTPEWLIADNCSQKCYAGSLRCDHLCESVCNKCSAGFVHRSCQQKCERH